MAAKKKSRTTTTSRAKSARKPASRRPAAQSAASSTPPRFGSAEKPRTKSEIYGILADHAGVSKKQVSTMFEALGEVLKKDLSKRGPGAVNLAGMMKIMVQRKPATKARKGVNPFTGEPTTFAAKPARNVVKVRPMKALKDLV